MKKLIIYLTAICVLVGVCFGVTNWDINGRPTSDWFSASDTPQNIPLNWMREVDPLIGASSGNIGTGNIYYVDSNVTNAGDGSSWTNAHDTLDEAIDLCTADNGDRIYVAQGHAETFTAADGWDADVAGISIIGCGYGDNRPTFTLNHADASVTIGDSGVLLYNVRIVASITAVTMGISVEAAADDCAIIGCEFPEPAAAGSEVVRMILVAAGADRLLVKGCIAYSADATGAQNFIDLDTGVQNGTMIVGNRIYGEYAEGPIHTDDADLEMYIAFNTVTNMTTGQHGIEIAGNATGVLAGNMVSTDAIGTSYDVGYMEELLPNYWDDYGTRDTSPVPWTTNETGVNRWGATELAQIEAEAQDALEVEDLDHLLDAAISDTTDPVDMSTEVADNTILADILTKTGTTADYERDIYSLMGLAQPLLMSQALDFRSVQGSAMPIALWWVDANIASSGDGKSPETAWKTIQEAITACSNSVDDWIFVFDYSGGGGTITMNKAFVHLIGNANKAMSYPRIKPASAVAGITFDAAGDRVEIANFVIGGGDQTVPAISFPVATAAGAYGVYIHDNVIGRDADAPCLEGILVASGGAAPYLVVENNRFIGAAGSGVAAAGSAIRISGNATRCQILGNLILDVGRTATPAIWLDGAVTEPTIMNNNIKIDTDTGTGGAITLGASVDDGWISGNVANDGKTAPGNNPFVDGATTNGWGTNYTGKDITLP